MPLRATLLLALGVAALGFRLYRLDEVPGELYGDIAIIAELVAAIRDGKWPLYFVLSNGPLYGYLITPIILALGSQGYLPYKVASVLVSLAGIMAVVLLLRSQLRLLPALIGVLAMACGSWYVVFSRLGNAQVLIPVLSATSYALLLLGSKGRPGLVTAGLWVSAMGFFAMPQAFVLPIAYLLSASLLVDRARMKQLAADLAVAAIPFCALLVVQRENFFGGEGYIGSKAEVEGSPLLKIWTNVSRSALMLHVEGDAVFRSNPPGQPQLDPLSGILFLVGLAVCLIRPNAVRIAAFWIPFLVLQAPANLVLSEGAPTPSASRSIGVLPFLAIAIGIGAQTLLQPLTQRWARLTVTVTLCTFMLISNWERYFTDYTLNLPDENLPTGRLIAAEIDRLPEHAEVLMYSCCWGNWGQPEVKSVEYVLQRPGRVRYVESGQFHCEILSSLPRPVYVFWDPRERRSPVAPDACDPSLRPERIRGPSGETLVIVFSEDP